MSFILDALKKSESDRQRKTRPESDYVPTATGDSRPARWAWIVGGLLVINVAVLLVFMLRSGTAPPAPGEPTADATVSRADPQAAEPQTFRELVAEARDTVPETGRAEPAPVQSGALAAEPAKAPPPVASNRPSTDTVAYPTFNEARVNGMVNLPDLHLDIHVYSEKRNERFIFINMSKYKESATLAEGPSVFEIVPDGVILEYSGTRFLLPRE